mmetsp:Transcript_22370/g.48481  ORF Transcript_22370/g.48481 Transcript_22370/m.48481 type:complete len:311 (+) Transcript_22370:680-1612(+)
MDYHWRAYTSILSILLSTHGPNGRANNTSPHNRVSHPRTRRNMLLLPRWRRRSRLLTPNGRRCDVRRRQGLRGHPPRRRRHVPIDQARGNAMLPSQARHSFPHSVSHSRSRRNVRILSRRSRRSGPPPAHGGRSDLRHGQGLRGHHHGGQRLLRDGEARGRALLSSQARDAVSHSGAHGGAHAFAFDASRACDHGSTAGDYGSSSRDDGSSSHVHAGHDDCNGNTAHVHAGHDHRDGSTAHILEQIQSLQGLFLRRRRIQVVQVRQQQILQIQDEEKPHQDENAQGFLSDGSHVEGRQGGWRDEGLVVQG